MGLQLTPRDMAKFGYLYLNRGAWDGRQLVPADWVRLTTMPQDTALHRGNGQIVPIEWYGMQWWTWRPELFGGQRAVVAQGFGGESVMLLPDLDMIVVTTTEDSVTPGGAEAQGNRIYDLVKFSILRAVTDAGAPDPFWAAPPAPPARAHALYTAGADGRGRALLLDDAEHQLWGPAWSPDGRKLAFGTKRDGEWRIYTMNPDGSGQQSLPTPADGNSPSWSPDGAAIAFMSERNGSADIFVMDADGANQQLLAGGEGWDYLPTWSPDGTRVAFASTRDGDAAIFVAPGAGGNPRKVSGRGLNADVVSWAPDGARLLFHGLETGGGGLLERLGW